MPQLPVFGFDTYCEETTKFNQLVRDNTLLYRVFDDSSYTAYTRTRGFVAGAWITPPQTTLPAAAKGERNRLNSQWLRDFRADRDRTGPEPRRRAMAHLDWKSTEPSDFVSCTFSLWWALWEIQCRKAGRYGRPPASGLKLAVLDGKKLQGHAEVALRIIGPESTENYDAWHFARAAQEVLVLEGVPAEAIIAATDADAFWHQRPQWLTIRRFCMFKSAAEEFEKAFRLYGNLIGVESAIESAAQFARALGRGGYTRIVQLEAVIAACFHPVDRQASGFRLAVLTQAQAGWAARGNTSRLKS